VKGIDGGETEGEEGGGRGRRGGGERLGGVGYGVGGGLGAGGGWGGGGEGVRTGERFWEEGRGWVGGERMARFAGERGWGSRGAWSNGGWGKSKGENGVLSTSPLLGEAHRGGNGKGSGEKPGIYRQNGQNHSKGLKKNRRQASLRKTNPCQKG